MTLLSLLLACGPADPPAPACAPATAEDLLEVRGDYYVCLDGISDCGPDGYLLGYGARYAERYLLEVRPVVSPAGQAFLDAVSLCLQREMADFWRPERTCAELWDAGFSSHPDCYVASGFCDVDLESQLAIAEAVDPEDRALPDQQAQVLAVAERCLEAGL